MDPVSQSEAERRRELRALLRATIHDHHDERDVFNALTDLVPIEVLEKLVADRDREQSGGDEGGRDRELDRG